MKGVVLMVLLLSACNSVQPRLRQGDPDEGPFPPRRGGLPGDTVTGTQWPQVPPPDRVARQQRICRTQRVPGGWVIRWYETDPNACVGSTNEYNVAVIEDLSHYRIDAVIGICADQSIPGGWYEQKERAYECPGARVTQGSRTGITIRKENGDD